MRQLSVEGGMGKGIRADHQGNPVVSRTKRADDVNVRVDLLEAGGERVRMRQIF